jgi:type IV pilus assembly protein PilB
MSVLSAGIQKKVEDQLVKVGLLSAADVTKIKEEAAQKGQPFMALLTDGNYVTDEQLARVAAKVNKLPYVNLSKARIDPSVLELLPQDTAEHYMAVPLGEMQNNLVVAMLDADNVQAVDFLSKKIGRSLKVYAASESGIRNVLKQYKLSLDEDVTGKKAGPAAMVAAGVAAAPAAKDQNIKTIVQDSPISKALQAIMDYAATNRASDIHMEPTETIFKIRCRVDGMMREIMQLPKSTEAAMVSRVKILSNLKIDEHRVPQDGDFSIVVGGHKIDLRIAISPVVWGEQVVIRLLDKSGTSLRLEDMGYSGRSLRTIRRGIA